MTVRPDPAHAYGPANPLFPLLLQLGWGDLINLGYFTPATTVAAVVCGLAPAQRRLASKSAALLRLTPTDRVLDVACGRGATSDLLARRSAAVTGIDLLPEHVAQAERRFGDNPHVRFTTADATDLRSTGGPVAFDDAGFTKAHCLEAAFHFGSQGRRAFLEEMFRVLAPGGRLVLVDFVWRRDDPTQIKLLDPEHVIRDTWRFENFETAEQYRRHALDIGFLPRPPHDWTRPVIKNFMRLGSVLERLSSSPSGRQLLFLRWPALRALTPQDWQRATAVVQAHALFPHYLDYKALILDKPSR